MRREAATALRVQRHPLHPLLGGGFQFAREGAGPEHEDDVLGVGFDLGGLALRPFAEGLPLHHAAHPQVRDRQPRLRAYLAHDAGRDGFPRLHVPAGKRQPAPRGCGFRQAVLDKDASSSRVLDHAYVAEGVFIGCFQSLWILGMCRRLFLQPLPLGCANTRSYPIRPFQ